MNFEKHDRQKKELEGEQEKYSNIILNTSYSEMTKCTQLYFKNILMNQIMK